MTQSPIETRHKDDAAKAAGFSDWTEMTKYWAAGGPGQKIVLTHAQTLANLEAARADLADIERIAVSNKFIEGVGPAFLHDIANIAAPYRAKVDPLVEAFNRMPPTFDATIWAETARKTLDDLGLEIVERRDR